MKTCLLSPSLVFPSHRSVEQRQDQLHILLCSTFIPTNMSSTETSSFPSSKEHLSPVSTPATTPTGSPTTVSPAIDHLASTSERPVPGSFKFLPRGTELIWCSSEKPGSPGNHPALVLPSEDSDPDLVTVLFTTTKDVVFYCNSPKWACNYLPLEGQSHPWREAVPLAEGSFKKATSINVTTVYKVRWRDLEETNFKSSDGLAPCLSAETLEKVMKYVKTPEADKFTPWKTTVPQLTAFKEQSAASFNNSAAPAMQASPDPVSPTPATHSVPVLPPVAVLATVPTQGTAQKYVPPHLRQANGMNRMLWPPAPVLHLHPVHCSTSWR